MTDKQPGRMTRREFVTASTASIAVSGVAWQGFGASQPTEGQSEQPAGRRSRVIIDTDPGVDDALALLFALRSPELAIEGVTAVAGNVPLEFTLPNALRMVEISGRSD